MGPPVFCFLFNVTQLVKFIHAIVFIASVTNFYMQWVFIAFVINFDKTDEAMCCMGTGICYCCRRLKGGRRIKGLGGG